MSSDNTSTSPATAESVSNSNSTNKDNTNDNQVRSNDTNTTSQQKQDPYRVQVLSQYLVNERPPILSPIIPKTETPKEDAKKRGQNKKRPRDAKIAASQKACLQIIRGEDCPFANCKYSHDLKEMLANRPGDLCEGEGLEWLRGECPNWKLRG
jgi:hypothetical protein